MLQKNEQEKEDKLGDAAVGEDVAEGVLEGEVAAEVHNVVPFPGLRFPDQLAYFNELFFYYWSRPECCQNFAVTT